MSSEYAVILMIAVGALTAMTVYMRRTIQGRAHDAQVMALSRAGNAIGTPLRMEYEPYYYWAVTKTDTQQVDTSRVVSFTDYRKELELNKATYVESVQEPPEN